VSGVPPRARCQVDPTPRRNPLSDRPGHAPLDCLRDRRVSSERSPRHSQPLRHAGVQRQSRKSQRGPQAASRWLHLTTGGANDLSFSFPHVLVPSPPLHSSSTPRAVVLVSLFTSSSGSERPSSLSSFRVFSQSFSVSARIRAGELGKPRGDMDGLPRELCLKIFHLLDHQSLASSPQGLTPP
jgi:hypothetical protein